MLYLMLRTSQTSSVSIRFACVLVSLGLLPTPQLAAQIAEAPAVVATPSTQAAAAPTGWDSFIEDARVQWSVPGLSVAIVKDGEVVLSKGYGLRQAGQTETADADTLFAIASNTKAFTAAGLSLLVAEGKLTWDDHVHDYLPWLQLDDPLATADLRIRDLLCHRSGLGTFSGDLLWWGTSYTPREVLQRARQLPAAGPFRAHYGYSNLMFLAAGQIIEQRSGLSWGDFISQRVLAPQAMNRTLVSTIQLSAMGNFATPHKTLLDASVPLEWMNWDSMAAAGGIISSSNDMAKWLQTLQSAGLPGGGKPLLEPSQLHEMWHPQTIIPISNSASGRSPETHFKSYGLGWSLSDYHGKKLVGHGGGYDGMYSKVLLVPEENLGVVVLSNSMTGLPSTLASAVVDSYLGVKTLDELRSKSETNLSNFRRSRERFNRRIQTSIKANPAGANLARPLADYAGQYACPLYGAASVREQDGQLILNLHPNQKLVADLEHLHFNTFRIRWENTFAWFGGGNVHFIDDAQGNFVGLEIDVPNDDMWFDELNFVRTQD